jgi:hypothetical protein
MVTKVYIVMEFWICKGWGGGKGGKERKKRGFEGIKWRKRADLGGGRVAGGGWGML